MIHVWNVTSKIWIKYFFFHLWAPIALIGPHVNILHKSGIQFKLASWIGLVGNFHYTSLCCHEICCVWNIVPVNLTINLTLIITINIFFVNYEFATPKKIKIGRVSKYGK